MTTKRKGTHDGHNESEIEPLHFDGQKRGGFGEFLYDKKTGKVMGRKGFEWCQLTGFYILLYTFLIGFWIAYLYGFMTTVSVDRPSLTGYDSMLKLNPAVGYRPQPDFESNLIKFTASKPDSYKTLVKDLDDVLQPYFNETILNNLDDCSDGITKATKFSACKFNPLEAAPNCFNGTEGSFGFSNGQPCVILKMNRIFGWMPASLPDGNGFRDVRIRCIGENAADNETLGEISFYPGGVDSRGTFGTFPSYYFPFHSQKYYLSPLVFAQFKNIKPYTVALIWCQLEAEDVTFGDTPFYVNSALNDRAGGAHFELVVDL